MTDAKQTEEPTMFDLGPKTDPKAAEKAEKEAKRQAAMSKSQKDAEKRRKENEQKKKEAEEKKKREEARVYPAGTEIKYVNELGRETIALPEDMKKAQIIEWLQDDYPEVSETRVELRYDEKRNRVVVQTGSFKKG